MMLGWLLFRRVFIFSDSFVWLSRRLHNWPKLVRRLATDGKRALFGFHCSDHVRVETSHLNSWQILTGLLDTFQLTSND